MTLVTIVFQLHHSLIAIQKLRNRMKRKGQGMRDEKGKGEVEKSSDFHCDLQSQDGCVAEMNS